MNSTHRHTLYAAGRITKVFGVRGEVKIYSYARTSSEYETLRTVKVGADDRTASDRTIEQARDRGGEVYIKFEGIDDRTAAETLVNCFVYVSEDERKQPDAGRHYIHDLLGCRVVDEGGAGLGTLSDVMNVAGRLIYVVATTHGDVLVPAVEEFIAGVNIDQKTVILRPPEGMFEGDTL